MLNADLCSFEESLSNSVPPRIQRFLFDGIAQLISHVLQTNMPYIRRLNRNGVVRLIRNVHSLQQNLTNLSSIDDTNLSRILTFTELALLTGPELLEYVAREKGKFAFDEYKVVLDLIYLESNTAGDEAEVKIFNECQQRLKAYFVSNRS